MTFSPAFFYNREEHAIFEEAPIDYIAVQEAVEKWNLSLRLAPKLYTVGRNPGAQKFGPTWAIPANADKPEDLRRILDVTYAPSAH